MGVLTDIIANSKPLEVPVAIGPGTINDVIGGDVSRYAIGFSWGFLSGTGNVITTNPDPALASGFIPPSTGIRWFTVKDHGPLVSMAWYARGAGLGNILTVWVVRLPKE